VFIFRIKIEACGKFYFSKIYNGTFKKLKSTVMRIVFVSISLILLIMFGAFNKKREDTNNTGFRKNIKFNHLFIVIDDSTYKYLIDSLKFPENFAKTSENTTGSGSDSWTGKYIYGISNYLEIFKPGGAKGTAFGDFGLGFGTNKFGTIDSLQNYWMKTLDSIHIENMVITDSGKSSPWFKSVSIPNVDSLKISAWVMENSREEMNYAGFTETDLSGEIEYSEYAKHVRAKLQNIPVDSVKNDRLFDKVTSLDINNKSFSKENFIITYSLTKSEHFLLKEIGFSLLKKVPKEKYSFRKIEMTVGGDIAKIKFRYL
jgi:Family of unknown function (DUF5829)